MIGKNRVDLAPFAFDRRIRNVFVTLHGGELNAPLTAIAAFFRYIDLERKTYAFPAQTPVIALIKPHNHCIFTLKQLNK